MVFSGYTGHGEGFLREGRINGKHKDNKGKAFHRRGRLFCVTAFLYINRILNFATPFLPADALKLKSDTKLLSRFGYLLKFILVV
jgi:hypothetical protein